MGKSKLNTDLSDYELKERRDKLKRRTNQHAERSIAWGGASLVSAIIFFPVTVITVPSSLAEAAATAKLSNKLKKCERELSLRRSRSVNEGVIYNDINDIPRRHNFDHDGRANEERLPGYEVGDYMFSLDTVSLNDAQQYTDAYNENVGPQYTTAAKLHSTSSLPSMPSDVASNTLVNSGRPSTSAVPSSSYNPSASMPMPTSPYNSSMPMPSSSYNPSTSMPAPSSSYNPSNSIPVPIVVTPALGSSPNPLTSTIPAAPSTSPATEVLSSPEPEITPYPSYPDYDNGDTVSNEIAAEQQAPPLDAPPTYRYEP